MSTITSFRRALTTTAAAAAAVAVTAAPAAAHTATEPTVDAYTMSPGRLAAIVAALLALASLGIGALALIRPAGLLGARRGPLGLRLGTGAGAVAILIGCTVVVTADGGLGTGNGLGGGIVAAVLGLAGILLGLLARRRARTS